VLDDLRDDDEGSDDKDSGEDDAAVAVSYQQLPDAVVERSDSGIPRENPENLRRALCEGRDGEPVIFYRLVVATHWHYYWLCSETQARRASSSRGARHIRRWLKGFKRQATTMSAGCNMGRPVLRGTHESGVRATAYCDGRIVLLFPDGGKTTKSFSSQGYNTGGAPVPAPAGTAQSCPPCPTCPQSGVGSPGDCSPPRPCPVCPTCASCPVCQACPPPKPCDCRSEVVKMGKKFWLNGVKQACARYCALIYGECRRINPKTAMCSMLQEHCEKNCSKP